MGYQLICAGITDVGRSRDNNEDAFLADAGLGLLVVADGVGGRAHGEEASKAAIESAEATVHQKTATEDSMQELFNDAQQAVKARGETMNSDISTTLTALHVDLDSLLTSPQAILGNCGDSPCIAYDGKMTELFEDHSVVGEHLRNGMSRQAALDAAGWRKNTILRALGIDEYEPSVRTIALVPGTVYLLCSDGLTDMVNLDDEDLLVLLNTARGVTSNQELEVICQALVELANSRGGRDNIAVVLGMIIEI